MANKKQKTKNEINYHSLHCDTFEKQKHCDVFFKCKNENDEWASIGAHKIFLSSVSDVFEKCFYGELAESGLILTSNEIQIDDITMEAFIEFLSFIYGKSINFKDCLAVQKFYYAAHKYNCKEALDFVIKYALESINTKNAILYYEIAVRHQGEVLKEACIQIFKENVSAVLSSSVFLRASPETVNFIFQLEIPAVFSEIDFVWALERYIAYNKNQDPDIAKKVRASLNSIRFLTMEELDITETFLLTEDEKKSIIECLPLDSDLSKMPSEMSNERMNREFRLHFVRSEKKWESELNQFHNREVCIDGRSGYDNHYLWICPRVKGNKQKIKEIFDKYQHRDLNLYSHDDLEALYEAHKYNCKEALDFVIKYALESISTKNAIVYYETALRHQSGVLKRACTKVFRENISAVLSSSVFLIANPETVNFIFKFIILAVFSEMDFIWALERYIAYNNQDPDIANKVRPSLNSIRFLTMDEIDITQTSLLTEDEKKSIIECLPLDADLSKMPSGMSNERKSREFRLYFVKSDMVWVTTLQEIHKSSVCFKCPSWSNDHVPWDCTETKGDKLKIKEIFEKYQHKNLILYSHDDLEELYEAYKTTGFIK